MESEKLTNKEEEVMQVLWTLQHAFVKDMLPLFTEPRLHYNTLSTIIRNLEEKGYVAHRQFGNTYEYFPAISKEDYQNNFVLKKVVGNYFNDSYKDLVAYFAKNEKVSPDELREIIRMIEEGE
ncbi:BlaI/MecI/CopY family transcriptional regulator [Dyadobacter sp. LHD-138]|uniref:BlaI/MecI/CopY family transcriptional regulator n=1 Tax=Dyadobacter sp. LHD-138 TaxID=3071413 RepID=UPI0027DF0265|nr:BlaI/MecI/CopY family transcriptional regulator [Dyadobacter sp. LHD-138]MDQ6481626.1 BlaI/MecI/CopY family transcriptional regulator [Dyadobacter sp. LHD-138]